MFAVGYSYQVNPEFAETLGELMEVENLDVKFKSQRATVSNVAARRHGSTATEHREISRCPYFSHFRSQFYD